MKHNLVICAVVLVSLLTPACIVAQGENTSLTPQKGQLEFSYSLGYGGYRTYPSGLPLVSSVASNRFDVRYHLATHSSLGVSMMVGTETNNSLYDCFMLGGLTFKHSIPNRGRFFPYIECAAFYGTPIVDYFYFEHYILRFSGSVGVEYLTGQKSAFFIQFDMASVISTTIETLLGVPSLSLGVRF